MLCSLSHSLKNSKALSIIYYIVKEKKNRTTWFFFKTTIRMLDWPNKIKRSVFCLFIQFVKNAPELGWSVASCTVLEKWCSLFNIKACEQFLVDPRNKSMMHIPMQILRFNLYKLELQSQCRLGFSISVQSFYELPVIVIHGHKLHKTQVFFGTAEVVLFHVDIIQLLCSWNICRPFISFSSISFSLSLLGFKESDQDHKKK